MLPFSARSFLANLYFIQEGAIKTGREKFNFFVGAGEKSNENKAIFNKIFRQNLWKGDASRSGPSSNLSRTENLRAVLPLIANSLGIEVFLDAPCGDFYWMRTIASEFTFKYIGADIVPDLIHKNAQSYKSNNINFLELDIIKQKLPTADILFCRDCLFHFSYADIAGVLRNFLDSDCKYLMTTSHINRNGFENRDIKTGGWRWLDLFRPPFNFTDNHIKSVLDGGGDRYMHVWHKSTIAPAIEDFIRLQKLGIRGMG